MIRTMTWCLLALALWASAAQAGPEAMRRAAEQGDAEMQLELGVLYQYGFGLKQNQVPALAWYMVAAAEGNARAAARRDALKATLTAKQVADAERQAQVLRAIIAENEAKKPIQPAATPAAPATPAPVATPVSAPTAPATPAAAPHAAVPVSLTAPVRPPAPAAATPSVGPTGPTP